MKTFNSKSWRFVGAMVIHAGLAISAAAQERIVGGEISTDEHWQAGEIAAISRQIEPENSPFTDVYPGNGKSIRLKDGGSAPSSPFLEQQFDPVSGKVEWSFDFKSAAEDDENRGKGWVFALYHDDDRSRRVVAVGISDMVLITNREGMKRLLLPPSRMTPDSWYQFRATLDLTSGTWSGSLRSSNDEEVVFSDVPIEGAIGAEVAVTRFKLSTWTSANHTSFAITTDNFSLKPSRP